MNEYERSEAVLNLAEAATLAHESGKSEVAESLWKRIQRLVDNTPR